MPARFYAPDPPRDGRVRLGPDETHHLRRVCRLGVGDRVEVFDGRGLAWAARIVAFHGDDGDGVELDLEGEPLPERRPSCSLSLATAIPKGDRFDWLVEKATELGVERLVPLLTERSVVGPRGSKLARLRRSIIEASKQCRRARLMVLDEPMEWAQLVGSFAGSSRLIADPEGRSPQEWPAVPAGGAVVLAVGPEGGLSAAELELAGRSGWITVRLSVNTLRIETAGLVGSAVFLGVPAGPRRTETLDPGPTIATP